MAARARRAAARRPSAGNTTAVVLAAGFSSRMGRPKALVTVGGERMLERTLGSLSAAGVGPVIVVLGHRAAEVRRSVPLDSVTVVENPAYADGLSSSLRAGVRAAGPHARRVMVVLPDQPFVAPETYRELVRRAEEGDGSIFIPTYREVGGNPVLFDTRLAPELASLKGDVGCRAMFPRHTSEIREVPVDDPGILVDIDTEAELRTLETAIGRGRPLRDVLDRLSEPRWSLHASPKEHPVPKHLGRRPDIAAVAQELRVRRVPFALATVVRVVRPSSSRPGYQAIVREDGSPVGWIGGACTADLLVSEARAALTTGVPRILRVTPDPDARPAEEGVLQRTMTCQSGGTVEIFIEPNLPKPNLLIVGDSPVAASLAALGPLLGYRVILVAPGADPTELPDVDVFVPELEGIEGHLTPDTYAVVASMGKYDESALASLARADLAFVGLVASRKRAESVFAALREEGLTAAQLVRVRNPVGLDIAASTPEEIAVSIVAEVTRARRSAPPPSAPAAASPAPEGSVAVDPVCHMEVERTSPRKRTHAGTVYYFCSESCRRKFAKAPASFLA
ncbi:MAG: NTP transferase domain-containing protein [Thermoplasmata archaeon]